MFSPKLNHLVVANRVYMIRYWRRRGKEREIAAKAFKHKSKCKKYIDPFKKKIITLFISRVILLFTNLYLNTKLEILFCFIIQSFN